MKILSAKNPEFTERGDIDLLVTFGLALPTPPLRKKISPPLVIDPMEPLQFTASPNDCEPHGVELYNRAIAGEFGPIAPYVEPPVTLAQKQAEARAYLNSTDWYVTRKLETGAVIPADIAKSRQEARETIEK